jgi:hypothetical protein
MYIYIIVSQVQLVVQECCVHYIFHFFIFFPQLVKVTQIVISKTSLLLCTNHNLPPLVKFIVSLDFSCVLKSWTSRGKFEFVFFVRILVK